MSVAVGWSKDPNAKVNWRGRAGERDHRARQPHPHAARRRERSAWARAGAPPSLGSIPNNHRSYAIQWFLFAGIAALIYFLALRLRWKKEQA